MAGGSAAARAGGGDVNRPAGGGVSLRGPIEPVVAGGAATTPGAIDIGGAGGDGTDAGIDCGAAICGAGGALGGATLTVGGSGVGMGAVSTPEPPLAASAASMTLPDPSSPTGGAIRAIAFGVGAFDCGLGASSLGASLGSSTVVPPAVKWSIARLMA